MTSKNSGFSMLEGLILLLVVGVVAVVGYLAYVNFVAPDDTESSGDNGGSVVVKDESGLKDALSDLDNIAIDDDEGSQLDTAATSF